MRIAYVWICIGVAFGWAGALHAEVAPNIVAALDAYDAKDYAGCAKVMEAL
ncbi:hypothetical protein [Xanthomonas oryzae]|nr:hypothetical protein [Xanthomonas oryzae]UNE61891.1 hypothetical protein MML47_16550 [Xanthomonas oryzae]